MSDKDNEMNFLNIIDGYTKLANERRTKLLQEWEEKEEAALLLDRLLTGLRKIRRLVNLINEVEPEE
jgi:hypothetical protein